MKITKTLLLVGLIAPFMAAYAGKPTDPVSLLQTIQVCNKSDQSVSFGGITVSPGVVPAYFPQQLGSDQCLTFDVHSLLPEFAMMNLSIKYTQTTTIKAKNPAGCSFSYTCQITQPGPGQYVCAPVSAPATSAAHYGSGNWVANTNCTVSTARNHAEFDIVNK